MRSHERAHGLEQIGSGQRRERLGASSRDLDGPGLAVLRRAPESRSRLPFALHAAILEGRTSWRRDRVETMTHFGAGISTSPDPRGAAIDAAMAARDGGPAEAPSLAVVFASPHHAEAAAVVVEALHEAAGPATLIGCVGEAVVGGAREVEEDPAISVWLGWLPGELRSYHATFTPSDEGGAFVGFPEGDAGKVHLLVADPFSFPADRFLEELDERQPGTLVIGGMASGALRPGESRLFLGREVLGEGAVGVRLPADVDVRAVVSQGCRPIGPPLVVTRARANVIEELAGRPPLERLREIWAASDERDRRLLSSGLHIGRVIDERKEELERGDFLIRAVLGADRETGSLVVGDLVSVGETVRFHVRDAESADEDLRLLLDGLGEAPAGGLLFTCNGRGSRLFPGPDHDASLVASRLGAPPVAGFFCAGELGPVGPRTFLHGFTASLALFYDRS